MTNKIMLITKSNTQSQVIKSLLEKDLFVIKDVLITDFKNTKNKHFNLDSIQEQEISLIAIALDPVNMDSKFINTEKEFYQDLVDLIDTKFPIPIVYITSNSKEFDMCLLKTPFHELIVNSNLELELSRKIKNLLFFAKNDRELHDIRFKQQQIEKFSLQFRRKKLLDLIQTSFKFFTQEFGTELQLYFPPNALRDEFKRYRRNTKRDVEEVIRDLDLLPSWHSTEEFKFDRLYKMFSAWDINVVEKSLSQIQDFECPGGRYVVLPMNMLGHDLGHFVFYKPNQFEIPTSQSLMGECLSTLAYHLDQALAYDQVEILTFKDDLTELYNQRYLPVILDQEMQRASRHKHKFSVLFLDIDFFKLVNDSKGHLVGSGVIVQLSQLLKNSIRGTDFAFRYGGDEYVIVLSDADSNQAAQVAERLRKKTEETVFEIGGSQVKVTISIGIATYPEHAQSTQELLQMADDAMYKGKNKSRNIVYLAS